MSEQAQREMTLEEWVDRLPPDHKARSELAALKQALTLIGDIGYDYDGYGTPHDLKKLIDEMVGYARNPQSAVDALTAEEQPTHKTVLVFKGEEHELS